MGKNERYVHHLMLRHSFRFGGKFEIWFFTENGVVAQKLQQLVVPTVNSQKCVEYYKDVEKIKFTDENVTFTPSGIADVGNVCFLDRFLRRLS